jgi:Tol biopolymer transport system component
MLFVLLYVPAYGAAEYTCVGNFAVVDGLLWTSNPPTYTGQEAAAHLFGGNPTDYVLSVNQSTTDSSTITFTNYVDDWGVNYEGGPRPQAPENFALPARAAHSFHVEDMQRLSRVGGMKLSPDGKWVAFVVSQSDIGKNRFVRNIWIAPANGGAPQQMTFAEERSNDRPRWSPDSHYLYFLSTRIDKKPQIFRLAISGGEAKQITNIPTGIASYILSPNGKTIALTASVFPQCTDMACNEKAEKEHAENPVKVRVITEIPFRRWDAWVDGRRNHIFIMSAEGGATTDITPGDVDSPIWTEDGTEEVAFSPDSKEICFSRYVGNEALTGNSDLFVMPLTGGTPKAITTNRSTDRTPLYSPDGRYIAYSATLRPMQETDLTRYFCTTARPASAAT